MLMCPNAGRVGKARELVGLDSVPAGLEGSACGVRKHVGKLFPNLPWRGKSCQTSGAVCLESR